MDIDIIKAWIKACDESRYPSDWEILDNKWLVIATAEIDRKPELQIYTIEEAEDEAIEYLEDL